MHSGTLTDVELIRCAAAAMFDRLRAGDDACICAMRREVDDALVLNSLDDGLALGRGVAASEPVE